MPGKGQTATRHKRLMEIGRESLSLARLAEAHFDALAILEEAGRTPDSNAIYGVWASEIKGQPLQIVGEGKGSCIVGAKIFCTGAGIIDRALITVGQPDPILIDVNLVAFPDKLDIDLLEWQVSAFQQTRTATVRFLKLQFEPEDLVDDPGWYLRRPGFWHGACGPASCWAGGALGLYDYAISQPRSDPHTLAHLGGLQASVWALQTYLTASGDEIDSDPLTVDARISGPLRSDIWWSRGAPKYFSDWGERTARIRLLWRGPFLNATRNYNCIFASAMQNATSSLLARKSEMATACDVGPFLSQKHEQSDCSCTHDDGTQPP